VEFDKDRLAKLLNLTESEHDGEALVAIRKANDLLRQYGTNWSAALGLSEPAERSPPSDPAAGRSAHAATAPQPRRPAEMRRGHLPARAYRNAFRREPMLPRLLGFPFWIVVELLALVMPDTLLDTRGPILTMIFTLSMTLGIAAWIGLGYYVLFGLDFG
jgi:hypothetical protein